MKQRLICAAMVFGMLAAGARADVEFDTAIGYSHLSLEGSDRFEERDGARIEPRISSAPFENATQLRLGFGLGISGYSHELDDQLIITIDDGDDIDVIEADQWESVSVIMPDFQVSWRQKLNQNWFIEPGVAVGPVFANYYIASEWWWDDDDDETSEWDTTFGVRPFLRAGWQGTEWVFAAEASYLIAGDVELTDQVQGDLSELFIGGFFGFRW